MTPLGFRVREDVLPDLDMDRKYGTVGRKPREPPAYHILPRASYLVIPQDTPDLLSETKIQEDTSAAKRSMLDLGGKQAEEEEDIYISTKF